jgi:DNA-binding MltR family transcriptional regulator
MVKGKVSDELLNGNNAPIGTFSSRIDSTFALGLIDCKEHRDLHLIRKIRNTFGHKWRGVAFEASPVSDYCDSLRFRGLPICNIKIEDQPDWREKAKKDRRHCFIWAVTMLRADLLFREKAVTKERRQAKTWSTPD